MLANLGSQLPKVEEKAYILKRILRSPLLNPSRTIFKMAQNSILLVASRWATGPLFRGLNSFAASCHETVKVFPLLWSFLHPLEQGCFVGVGESSLFWGVGDAGPGTFELFDCTGGGWHDSIIAELTSSAISVQKLRQVVQRGTWWYREALDAIHKPS